MAKRGIDGFCDAALRAGIPPSDQPMIAIVSWSTAETRLTSRCDVSSGPGSTRGVSAGRYRAMLDIVCTITIANSTLVLGFVGLDCLTDFWA